MTESSVQHQASIWLSVLSWKQFFHSGRDHLTTPGGPAAPSPSWGGGAPLSSAPWLPARHCPSHLSILPIVLCFYRPSGPHHGPPRRSPLVLPVRLSPPCTGTAPIGHSLHAALCGQAAGEGGSSLGRMLQAASSSQQAVVPPPPVAASFRGAVEVTQPFCLSDRPGFWSLLCHR